MYVYMNINNHSIIIERNNTMPKYTPKLTLKPIPCYMLFSSSKHKKIIIKKYNNKLPVDYMKNINNCNVKSNNILFTFKEEAKYENV